MFRYFTIFVSPFLFLAGFWFLFYSQKNIHYWLLSLAVIIILLSGKILSRRRFFRFKILWLNLIFVYISHLLFLLLLTSQGWRYTLSFILSLSWMLIWWLIAKYFDNVNDVGSNNYLAVNKFFYYLAFWFLASGLYSLVIFIHFPLLYAYLILIIFSFFWSLDIIKHQENYNWFYLIFCLFILSQVVIVTYLLPVNFYVAGAISTLWFFFVIDNTANNLRSFRLYLGLFLLVVLLLLITTII